MKVQDHLFEFIGETKNPSRKGLTMKKHFIDSETNPSQGETTSDPGEVTCYSCLTPFYAFCDYFRLELGGFLESYEGCVSDGIFLSEAHIRQSYNTQQKHVQVRACLKNIKLKPRLGSSISWHFHRDLFKRFHNLAGFKIVGRYNILQRYKIDRILRIQDELSIPLSALISGFGPIKSAVLLSDIEEALL